MNMINSADQRARQTTQRGDTIVEVLITVSVIGIALAGAFGLANNAANMGRTAQERGEALKIAESQVEILKTASPAPTGTFCMKPDGTSVATGAAECRRNGQGTVDVDGLYLIENSLDGNGVYTLQVSWESINSASTNNTTLYYRLGAL